MRKIKKINGFLVVKFNDREKREYEGTALGEYGVIDAEVYTGNLDIDRGAMEYDDADTLEVAVELARGLESEEDITDEPPTYTAAVETNESYTEEAVEPAALIEGWTRRLATQVKSKHYPDTDPRTAAHELYGFKMALRQIGFLPESEVITDPDTFGAGRLDGPIEEINSTQNKDARIQSLQPFVKNGYIKFSKKHKTLLKQMTEYPMGKNDDAPDGLQMAVKLALDVKIGRRVDYRSVIARALDFRRGAY